MAKHRRGRANEPGANPLPLLLDDVYLLTAESDGQLALGGLSLVVDHQGLTVSAPNGTTAAAMAWSELTVLRTAGRTTVSEGEGVVVLEASTAARTHRFAVPSDNAGALEAAIAAVTGVPTADSPRRRRQRE
jgi:hypothetical protein